MKEEGESGKGTERGLLQDCNTLLDAGPSTWIFEFNKYEHAVSRTLFPRPLFRRSRHPLPKPLPSSFSRSQRTPKTPFVEMMLHFAIVTRSSSNPSDPNVVFQTFRFKTARKRRRATPNSQSTGHANRVNIVPRKWASRTTLAIPRPDNYFAASE